MEHREIEIAPGVSVPSVWSSPAAGRNSPSPCLVLAPGAGAGMHHPFLSFIHETLSHQGITTVKFDFPYRAAGRNRPDPPLLLLAAWRGVLARVRAELAPAPVFVGGRSMGGRIASMLLAEGESAAGLVLLAYPLQPAGKPEVLRSAHLPRVSCPILFVQGTRDALCDLDQLRPAIRGLQVPVRLALIDGADHSFKVPRSLNRGERAVWQEIAQIVAEWLTAPEVRRCTV